MSKQYTPAARSNQTSLMRTPQRQPTQAGPESVLGNQALQRMVESRSIQTKLSVSQPGDAYEQEAERVAHDVMSTSSRDLRESITPVEGVAQRAEKGGKDDEKKGAENKPKQEAKPKQDAKSKDEGKGKDDKGGKKEESKKKEDDKVKRQAEEKQSEEDEEKVMRAAAGQAPEVTSGMETELQRSRGAGDPLPESSRTFFEPRLGADLSSVRVHNDAHAAQLARQVNAKAFTHGQDIYFASGEYQPQSDSGRRLMAHELAHTLQQSGGGRPQPHGSEGTHAPATSGLQRSPLQVQRANETAPPAQPAGGAPAGPIGEEATGILNDDTVTFKQIEIPPVKLPRQAGKYGRPLIRNKKYNDDARAGTDQRNKWKKSVNAANIKTKLADLYKVKTSEAAAPAFYIFETPQKNRSGRMFSGDLDSVAKEMTTPYWDDGGKAKDFQVDHIVELQVANWPDDTSGNELDNMELLEASLNQSSGGTIKGAIGKLCTKFAESVKDKPDIPRTGDGVKKKYNLKFGAAVPGGGGKAATPSDVWQQSQIEAGDHITDKGIKVVNAKTLGGPNEVVVIPAAGQKKTFDTGAKVDSSDRDWLLPYKMKSKKFDTKPEDVNSATLGTLEFFLPEDNGKWESDGSTKAISIPRIPGAQYAGTLQKGVARDMLSSLKLKKLSPIEIDDVEIGGAGLGATGRINVSLPFLQGSTIDFAIQGNNVTFSKMFDLGEVKLPKPFTAAQSTLTVSMGTGSGVEVAGRVDFGIERVGKGYLEGAGGTSREFSLKGGFDFDSKVFNPAKVELKYENGEVSGEGTIGVKQGTFKGVKAASITIKYSPGTLSASGTVDLTIPGLQSVSMTAAYSEAKGMEIGAEVNLAAVGKILKGGKINLQLQQDASGEYDISGTGSASLGIPGIDAQVTASYSKGAFTVEAQAAFKREFASGTIQVGATNRAVDESGQPSGEATDQITAFGGGTVTVKLTEWLQGTVGVKILPVGEMELTGKLAVPSTVDIFPEKKLEKNIFKIGIDIPIVGVAVMGQRIGIFATIQGGLDAKASFGPGQLRNTAIEITYNPDHEEDTVVHGTAEFFIPAHAGLRMFVSGGLGAGIPIVSATAKLEVGGEVGIDGEAKASVDVTWTPTEGVDLKADASLEATPKFKFDITGKVLVEADLLIDTITLYEKSWSLASFEYGSNLTFGVDFPIHYKTGEPFDVSVDDLKFKVPDIDPTALLSDLVDQIA